MKSGAVISVLVLCAFASPALAQNYVGGPKSKPSAVGGPTKQTSPVVPASRTGSAPVSAFAAPKVASAPPKLAPVSPKVTSLPAKPACPNGQCAGK
jgi:hypothetical protein